MPFDLLQQPGRRRKVLDWVLGVDTDLDGVSFRRFARRLQVLQPVRLEAATARELRIGLLEHQLHEVDVVYQLRHAVLHLQPGIHL